MPTESSIASHGLTTHEVSQRYRVSEDKIRSWIKSGLLRAINTAGAKCRKSRFVVLPEALAEFERVRAAAEPPKVKKTRRRREVTDYYP